MKDSQAKARGIPYRKKKKNLLKLDNGNSLNSPFMSRFMHSHQKTSNPSWSSDFNQPARKYS
ncbi:hypothetical protein SAY86_022214 [Trapa natans]|uniref:ALOG domain-containing protein n=1 Tax=Trapa natans TaxID=22666 RepID=A0AAN7MM43_TRANT|nr:hypothetical protein SAY86_022214 [Trapa natans]